MHYISRMTMLSRLIPVAACLVFVFTVVTCPSASAQGLNWEGQTGAFITPFAYTSPSPEKNIVRPETAYHYLAAGGVVGGYHQFSVTAGAFKRVEFGYSRTVTQLGATPGLSPLFDGGFNIVHGKVNLLPENAGKKKYLPAISSGFVARTHVRHVGGVINSQNTSNGDFYLVATKMIPQTKAVPILLNFGIKGTNAALLGVGGNATAWQGRLFGAAAFVVKGPAGSAMVFGGEFMQNPRYIKDLPGPTLPTSLTYFVRIIPAPERVKLNVDFGVLQAAGKIAPGVDLKARHQFALGVSYHF